MGTHHGGVRVSGGDEGGDRGGGGVGGGEMTRMEGVALVVLVRLCSGRTSRP